VKVKHVQILGSTYTVREANKGELEQALRIASSVDAEDYLVRQCLLAPSINLDTVYAGIPARLAEEILEISGTGEDANTALQQAADAWVLTPAGKLETLMMGVLHLSPEQIKAMYSEDWHRAAAAAQLLASTLYNLPIQEYMDLGTEREKRTRIPKMPPVAR